MVLWLCFLTRIANRGCLRSFLQKQDSSFRYYMCPLQSIKSNQIGSICHLYIQKEQLETFLTKKKTPPWSTEPTETGGFNQVTSDPLVQGFTAQRVAGGFPKRRMHCNDAWLQLQPTLEMVLLGFWGSKPIATTWNPKANHL